MYLKNEVQYSSNVLTSTELRGPLAPLFYYYLSNADIQTSFNTFSRGTKIIEILSFFGRTGV
jgi:hypothetical protein